MQTKNIKAENTPVFTRNASVGNKSSFWVSVLKDFLGIAKIIKNTITGIRIPTSTIKLGVGEQSLKKHIIIPIIPKIHTAKVP
jgi:hypothetical protein